MAGSLGPFGNLLTSGGVGPKVPERPAAGLASPQGAVSGPRSTKAGPCVHSRDSLQRACSRASQIQLVH